MSKKPKLAIKKRTLRKLDERDAANAAGGKADSNGPAPIDITDPVTSKRAQWTTTI